VIIFYKHYIHSLQTSCVTKIVKNEAFLAH